MKHVMIDLETLGTDYNAVIVAVGAVLFDFETPCPIETWYANVDPRSCVDAGLTMTPETVTWWMQQNDSARELFKTKGYGLKTTLNLFSAWIKEHDPDLIWGNGADFDNVLMASAYKAIKEPLPWKYYKNACFRTMKNLFKVQVPREGIYHNALDDAIYQVSVLREINRIYGLKL